MSFDKELFEKISAWVDSHEEEMLTNLERLIKIPSVADRTAQDRPYGTPCKKVLDEMMNIATEKGFEGINREYYVEEFYLDKKEENIGIWSHLDVLPEGSGWEYPAFELTNTKGYIVGRGVMDDKGPAIAGLYAILCLKELGIEGTKGLSLFAGSDEEYGMHDIDYYASKYPFPDFNIVVDSRFPVNHGEKGNLTIELESEKPFETEILELKAGFSANAVPDQAMIKTAEGVFEATGISAHSANPQGSDNAIQKLCASLVKEEAPISLTDNDKEIFATIGKFAEGFSGEGLEINVSDDKLGALTSVASLLSYKEGRPVLTVNIRYPMAATQESLIEKIKEVGKAKGFKLLSASGSGPCYVSKDSEEVKRLMEVYNGALGKEEKPFTIGGGTYARKLPNAVGFGFRLPVESDINDIVKPGHGGIHSPDETIKITQFLTGTKLLAMGLAALVKKEN